MQYLNGTAAQTKSPNFLIDDLKTRGLLDSTLVIWMGEFGRHPAITSKNGNTAGRQHYPRAWTTVLVGGGIKGGQVIGKTDKEGADIVERPITGPNFLASVCKVLGIDYTKPGAQAFINSWADQFASWGADYLKLDGVGSFDIPDVQAWSNALTSS